MLRVTRPKGCGPRVYCFGLRVHHGSVGAALFVLGALLIATDRHDWPWPLIDP